MLTVLLSALLLAAPGATTPSMPQLAPPTDADSLQKLIHQEGCQWGSAKAILCLEVDVDMGFATIALALYSVNTPTPGTPTHRFIVYRDGNTAFDAKKFDKAQWDAAMAVIGKHTFTPARREKAALSNGKIALPGLRWALPKPIWTGAQARKCCRWTVLQATRFTRSAAVRLGLDCDFTGDESKKASACYVNDYNEESRDRRELVVVGPLAQRAPAKP